MFPLHSPQRKRSRPNPNQRCRKGAAMLEFALALQIYMVMIFALIFGGIRIFQNEHYTTMAKFLARRAIVRGKDSDKLSPWGPSLTQGYLGDGSEIGNLMALKFNGGDPTSIFYRLEWPDNGNDASRGDRVRVSISSIPLSTSTVPVTSPEESGSWTISASVTYKIVH